MDLKSFFAFGLVFKGHGNTKATSLLHRRQQLASSKSPEARRIPAHISTLFQAYLDTLGV